MTNKRFISLDLVKLISSIIVVFHHYQQSTEALFNGINFYGGVFLFGYIVELFFVISGFLSALNIRKIKEQRFKDFLFNKIKRFLPMYWLTLAIIFILLFIEMIVFKDMSISPDGIGIWKVFNNLLLSFSGGLIYYDNSLGFNNSIWFICVLLLCYSIFYYVVWISEKKKYEPVYYFFLISVVAFWCYKHDVAVPLTDSGALRGYCSFFLGAVLYYLFSHLFKYVKFSRKLFYFFIFALIVLGFIAKFKYSFFFDDPYSIMLFIVYPMIMYVAVYSDLNFDLKGIKYNTSLSFEIYIWHEVLLIVLMMITRIVPGFETIKNSYSSMLAFVCIVVLFGVLMCRIEKYVNKAVDKWLVYLNESNN